MSKLTEELIDRLRAKAATAPAKYDGATMDRKDLGLDEWLDHLIDEQVDQIQYAMKSLALARLFQPLLDRAFFLISTIENKTEAVDAWLDEAHRCFSIAGIIDRLSE